MIHRDAPRSDSVMVVGPGSRFLSGIGYHTASIANAFARRGDPVSALLIRDLLPRRFYPGRNRVGTHDPGVLRLQAVPTHEGLNWYWGRSLFRALRFLRQRRPEVVLLQWWTAVTAHSYVVLALGARLVGARVVIEMHESHDVGEATLPLISRYARLMMRILARSISGVVVHSESDIDAVSQHYPALAQLPFAVVFPGPLEHAERSEGSTERQQQLETGMVRFLLFGVIRAYKGIDELAKAFARLVEEGEPVHLTIAGEVWEDAEFGMSTIRSTGPQHHTVIPGYIPDERVKDLFDQADVIVAPYRRASASGPVNLAMEAGLPLVTTRVPALQEACREYEGVFFADVEDPTGLREAMRLSMTKVGCRFANPHSWDANADRYAEFFELVLERSQRSPG